MLLQKVKYYLRKVTQLGIQPHHSMLLRKQLELTNTLLAFLFLPIIVYFFFDLKPGPLNKSIPIIIGGITVLALFFNYKKKNLFSRLALCIIFPLTSTVIPFLIRAVNNPVAQYVPAYFNSRGLLAIGLGLTLILLDRKKEKWLMLGLAAPTAVLLLFYKPYYEFGLQTSLDEVALFPLKTLNIVIGTFIGFLIMLIFQLYVNNKFESALIAQKNKIYTQSEEILTQNEELQQSQEEIVSQRDYISEQNKLLSEKNHRITSSIRYAKSIQQSILPEAKLLNQVFQDHFIIYRPKDIVSGDFYWLHQADSYTAFAVSDCTGHGVPGAFMSMLGVSILNDIFEKNEDLQPHDALNLLDQKLSQVLQQDSESTGHDGMDIALCIWKDIEDNQVELHYAGAKSPLYLITDGELTAIRGTRKSIGYSGSKRFETHQLTVKKGTTVYLNSDGYVDQNGMSNKKLGTKRLKDLLTGNAHQSLSKQKEALELFLQAHQQDAEQRDDITICGFMV